MRTHRPPNTQHGGEVHKSHCGFAVHQVPSALTARYTMPVGVVATVFYCTNIHLIHIYIPVELEGAYLGSLRRL